ncbi:large conductance mechanosensitive channel protein MscL [Aestuariivirga sp.]|uniref:large conductance mechanosensitive channel protein MscL n=1 Tax=Aestuariivirga sp. TaxID=2650926 RepID=UPI0039193B8C
MWSEFKSFAFKGNAFDLAIGVIIGAAFSRIVDGIVTFLINPIIGALLGGLNFNDYFLPLTSGITASTLAEAQKQGAVLAYGAFLTVVINFLIVAFVLFQLVKVSNRMRRAEPPLPPPPPNRTEELLADIRDTLKSRAAL